MLLASGLYALGGKLKNQNKSTMKTSFAVLQRITRQVFKGGPRKERRTNKCTSKNQKRMRATLQKKNLAFFCMCVEKDPKISFKELAFFKHCGCFSGS